jgi:hypothetical protein
LAATLSAWGGDEFCDNLLRRKNGNCKIAQYLEESFKAYNSAYEKTVGLSISMFFSVNTVMCQK